jgi:small GTP-binding protein
MLLNQQSATTKDLVLKKMSDDHIRVAVVGNVDAGKSTLIGTLTSSTLDDGRGSGRAHVMKHKHELESGRTSTIGSHLLGLMANGDVISGGPKNESMIACNSDRLVTLMDLAGHEKYLKTTIAGVSRGMADYALVLVNAMQPPTHMTMHHLTLCVTSGIPVVVVMTKTDRCPSHVFENTKNQMNLLLRSPDIGLKPFHLRSENDIETVKDKLSMLTPVLSVSSVTGDGLDWLRKLLVALPKRRQHQVCSLQGSKKDLLRYCTTVRAFLTHSITLRLLVEQTLETFRVLGRGHFPCSWSWNGNFWICQSRRVAFGRDTSCGPTQKRKDPRSDSKVSACRSNQCPTGLGWTLGLFRRFHVQKRTDPAPTRNGRIERPICACSKVYRRGLSSQGQDCDHFQGSL